MPEVVNAEVASSASALPPTSAASTLPELKAALETRVDLELLELLEAAASCGASSSTKEGALTRIASARSPAGKPALLATYLLNATAACSPSKRCSCSSRVRMDRVPHSACRIAPRIFTAICCWQI